MTIEAEFTPVTTAQWPALMPTQPDSPFTDGRFWQALQATGAIGPQTDWRPHQLSCQGLTLPVFVKAQNRGEYVFDYHWANAHQRHGLPYQPRLVTAVPFTPVTGQRFWPAAGQQQNDLQAEDTAALDTDPDAMRAAIVAMTEAVDAHSWHGLFMQPRQIEWLTGNQQGPDEAPLLIQRTNCQFLWTDQGYGDFAGFLDQFTAKRRKNVRQERRKVADQGLHCQWLTGTEITADWWRFFYQCYAMTYHERGQQPYLSLAFFEQIGQHMTAQLAMNVASLGDQPVAAALFFRNDQTLYGRYWGSLIHADSLHFEVCYYQGIEYALANGLRYFDPGTQGEHKLLRGFGPVLTHSLHYIRHPEMRRAIAHACAEEQEHIQAYYADALSHLPFKHA